MENVTRTGNMSNYFDSGKNSTYAIFVIGFVLAMLVLIEVNVVRCVRMFARVCVSRLAVST